MNLQLAKNDLAEAIAIMDECGRLNEGGNSRMLWNYEWNRLRELLYNCFEKVDKKILEKLQEVM